MQHRPRLRPRATIVSSTLVAAGAFGLAVLTAAPAQAAPTATTATIDAPATVTVGTAFDVDLTIPDTADVYAYEITLEADSVEYRDDSVTGPDGGFDSVEQDGDALTIVHTRLGTSPALEGDLATSISLTPTAVGSVDLDVTSITLVGTDGTSTTLDDPASTTIAIAAAATATPTPAPSATPTPGATTQPGTGTGGGTGDPSDPTDPTSGATAVAATGGDDRPTGGDLAWTGADVAPWIAASIALLAAGGTLITLRARRARRDRTGASA
ncbi:hypothetical protein DEJ17_12155 [Curtobacterium sp. MCSS17_011]|uniref:hypothetical protein n=1 Tax=Curtobacterium sp. MCSS17_011 TaxID=2175643 RepID=UPI000D9FC747|nr:hypothetical protein [Curtobacterium sp. MCSS17_011]PYY56001.1 hypothetical protein DEJ17_12155 [Curtobacterium sp. MCSS17_011]